MFGLVMVVSHEKVLSRALSSVKHLADQYLIQFDSEDDPGIKTVKEVLGDKGETIVVPWKNHGYNRSVLMLQARARLTTKYIFWLDGKEVLVGPDYGPVDRDALLAELDTNYNVFMATTHYGNTHYERWQFVLNNQLYYWQYVIHEQLRPTLYERRMSIKSVVNYVNRDGASGYSREKYMRYAKLCVDNINNPGEEQHYTFYGAQSFKDAGDHENAIKLYRSFIERWPTGDWAYTSYNMLAFLTSNIEYYKQAIVTFPDYAFSYYYLAQSYAKKDDYRNAVDTLVQLKCRTLKSYAFEDMSIYDKIDSDLETFKQKL